MADDATPTSGPIAEKTVDRTKAFTDAVVAIAMTLLVLPLLESTAEIVTKHESVHGWAGAHARDMAYFLLSFWLISGYWRSHERIFQYADGMTDRLHNLNFVWMVAIVAMPVVTALLSGPIDVTQVALYIGALVVGSACLTRMSVLIGHEEDRQMPPSVVAHGLASTFTSAAALVIGLVLLSVSRSAASYAYLALTLHLLDGRLADRFLPTARRLLRRPTGPADHAA